MEENHSGGGGFAGCHPSMARYIGTPEGYALLMDPMDLANHHEDGGHQHGDPPVSDG
jgi:hypothetical protein